MVREARFAWDSDQHQPEELTRSVWDCDETDLDDSTLDEPVKLKKQKRSQSQQRSPNQSKEK